MLSPWPLMHTPTSHHVLCSPPLTSLPSSRLPLPSVVLCVSFFLSPLSPLPPLLPSIIKTATPHMLPPAPFSFPSRPEHFYPSFPHSTVHTGLGLLVWTACFIPPVNCDPPIRYSERPTFHPQRSVGTCALGNWLSFAAHDDGCS